jgi:hypothetical protein
MQLCIVVSPWPNSPTGDRTIGLRCVHLQCGFLEAKPGRAALWQIWERLPGRFQ